MNKEGLNSLNPYLTFNGRCREAVEFYASALGAELNILPFRGSPLEKEVPEEDLDKVMHATISYENIILMASDNMPGQTVEAGSNVSLSIAATSRDEALKFFQNLSRGGSIVMPFEKTFWGADFGMCIDPFGIHWMVNFEPPAGE